MTPRTTPSLLGQEAVEQLLIDAIAADRLPHGLILSGEWGIGKATLAFNLAKYLFAPAERQPGTLAISATSPVSRRVASSGHGDLIVIERETDISTGKVARDVTVEDVRRIAPFLRMTAAEGGWRVAIIDDAASLNRAGQNALLKILEEPPPKTVLVLVCDRPGLLLPTIHSRCRLLRLSPLQPDVLDILLQQQTPELNASERQAIATLAEGSIGRALRLVEQEGLPLYGDLVQLLDGLPRPDWQAIHGFADRLGGPLAEHSYRLFGEFLNGWLTRLVKSGAGQRPALILEREADIYDRLSRLAGLDRWLDACENIRQRLSATDSANLDRRLAVWSVFETLSSVGAGQTT